MSSIIVSALNAALTADGTATGTVTIADTTTWIPGVKGNIRDNDSTPIAFVVVKVVSSTVLQLRSLESTEKSKYGFSSMAAFTVAQQARIFRDQQTVPVNQSFTALQRKP